jgi:hypothetical protein
MIRSFVSFLKEDKTDDKYCFRSDEGIYVAFAFRPMVVRLASGGLQKRLKLEVLLLVVFIQLVGQSILIL